ncbi:hypothetical protein ACS0TY_032790 [Phlomoides rotata]
MDAKNVVEFNSVFGDIVEGCKGLLSTLPAVVVKWIPRDANVMAHCIAKVARDFSSPHFLDERPACVDGVESRCEIIYVT